MTESIVIIVIQLLCIKQW